MKFLLGNIRFSLFLFTVRQSNIKGFIKFCFSLILLSMSDNNVVGQLKGAKGPINIEWEIVDFLSLSADVDDYHNSPTYFFCDSSWYFRLCPNGKKEDSSEGYIGVCVFRGDSGPPVSATWSLFLKKTGGRKEVVIESKQTFGEKYNGWGKPKAILRSELIEKKSEFLPSGVLTLMCSLKCDVGGAEKLSDDLKGLLVSGNESDVTFMVQDKEFRLHRAILAARTPVFNSMFKHDMKEKATGVVSVDDSEAGTFRSFVHYLYTGSTDELSTENVFCLYKMADKYQIDELKASCLAFMKGSVSVNTFCQTLDFALLYEEKDLIELATDFLSGNASDIMGTEDFRSLMRDKTKEISELLMKVVTKNNK